MPRATVHGRRSTLVEEMSCDPFCNLRVDALVGSALPSSSEWNRCAENDEQFRGEAKPSIVLNEGGYERRERRCANAESESRRVAARRVGRSRALANETRGEEDLRTTIPSRGFARTESDSSHVPGNSNPNAIYLYRQNEWALNDAVRFARGASRENRHGAYSHPRH